MKKSTIVILLSVPGFCNALESLECNFIDKYTNVTGYEAVSHLNDTTIVVKRNDSLFVAKTDYNGALYDLSFNEALTNLKAEGQIAYNGKDTYYFTNNGKLYSAKMKGGKMGEKVLLEVPGTSVKREKYDHSALVYCSWHYLPDDSIRVSNPAFSKNTLYFSANLKDSKGRDIYSTQISSSGRCSQPKRLGKNINSNGDEDYPHIRKDGRITFCSNRQNPETNTDKGNFDVYIGKNDNKSVPELMRDFVERNRIPVIVEDTTTLLAATDTVKPISDSEKLLNALKTVTDSSTFSSSAKELSDVLSTKDTMIMASKHVVAGKDLRIFYFDLNSDQLSTVYKKDIEAIVDFINFYPNSNFHIIGHTDERGDDLYNEDLSIRRAMCIQNELIKAGISRDRLEVFGYGERKLIIENAKTEDEHQKNRRVEILKID
ncbi:MAG: OmpA family protein [Paludibacteraceae bacterium]|nr:OmpA family protein [Paludibacteraceae bacterium]